MLILDCSAFAQIETLLSNSGCKHSALCIYSILDQNVSVKCLLINSACSNVSNLLPSLNDNSFAMLTLWTYDFM